MRSVNHPKPHDPVAMMSIKAAFHDVWETVQAHDDLYRERGTGELKAAIIRRLIDLVANGTTNPEELKAQVLKNLPLG